MDTYIIEFDINGKTDKLNAMVEEIKKLKKMGYVANASMDVYENSIVFLEIKCKGSIYSDIRGSIFLDFSPLLEMHIYSEKGLWISHITKEQLKESAKQVAQKTASGAKKVGEETWKHRKEIAKVAETGAVLLL